MKIPSLKSSTRLLEAIKRFWLLWGPGLGEIRGRNIRRQASHKRSSRYTYIKSSYERMDLSLVLARLGFTIYQVGLRTWVYTEGSKYATSSVKATSGSWNPPMAIECAWGHLWCWWCITHGARRVWPCISRRMEWSSMSLTFHRMTHLFLTSLQGVAVKVMNDDFAQVADQRTLQVRYMWLCS
jgi:hypothetical protein